MKNLFCLTLLFLTSNLWAIGYIDCKFQSETIDKATILLNPGSEAIAIEFKESGRQIESYINGRDQEMVSFNAIENTNQYLLQAQNFAAQTPNYTAIFYPSELQRHMVIELFSTHYGETKRFNGLCLIIE